MKHLTELQQPAEEKWQYVSEWLVKSNLMAGLPNYGSISDLVEILRQCCANRPSREIILAKVNSYQFQIWQAEQFGNFGDRHDWWRLNALPTHWLCLWMNVIDNIKAEEGE